MKVISVLGILLLLGACTVADIPFPSARDISITQISSEDRTGPALTPGALLLTQRNDRKHRQELRVLDVETGEDQSDFPPIPVGSNPDFAFQTVFSRDGGRLAGIETRGQTCETHGDGAACRGQAEVLHLVDLQSWQEVTRTLPPGGWVGPATFSPDNTRLVMVHTVERVSTLLVVGPETGVDLIRHTLSFRPSQLFYSQDGSRLALFGAAPGSDPGVSPPEPLQLSVLDAATMTPVWTQAFPDILNGDWCTLNCQAGHAERRSEAWKPAVVPSHDGNRLFIVDADKDRLTIVDLVGRTVTGVAVHRPLSWIESLLAFTAHSAEAKGNESGAYKEAALSSDGTTLYVIGRTTHFEQGAQDTLEHIDRSLGLQVLDVPTGRLLADRPVDAAGIRIAGDGSHLLLVGWDETGTWTDIWSLPDLQPVAHMPDWEIASGRRLDGQPEYLAVRRAQARSELARLDPVSFRLLHSWRVDTYSWWVLAP